MLDSCIVKENRNGNWMSELDRNDCLPERKVTSRLNNVKGITVEISDMILIEAVDKRARYIFCNIPGQINKSGINVLFEADIKEVSPNELWMGSPGVLKNIKILDHK